MPARRPCPSRPVALLDGHSAVSGQPCGAANSSAKYDCAACEDFGMIVDDSGQGTALCTAPGCAAAERLQRQSQQSAAAEAPVPGTAPEPTR